MKRIHLSMVSLQLTALMLSMIALSVPLAQKASAASMAAAMCKIYSHTDSSGQQWYKVRAKFENYTFKTASMMLSVTLVDGRRFDHPYSSSARTPSITTVGSFKWNSKATASISNSQGGAIATIDRIAYLSTCNSI